MASTIAVDERWAVRRRRTRELRDRFPFAREVLNLYDALLGVQEAAFERAQSQRPTTADVAEFIASEVLPAVLQVSIAAGPPLLSAESGRRRAEGDLDGLVAHWLGSLEQTPVEGYLARAAGSPVLEALGPAGADACSGPRGAHSCPRCGGLPQLSYSEPSGETLLSSRRLLLCSRCMASWTAPRMVCPACGESATSRLPIYAEAEWFAHIRVEGCESCHRYLLAVDLSKEGSAVPLVDDLAAIPLAMFAQERGLSRIVPNLMGL